MLMMKMYILILFLNLIIRNYSFQKYTVSNVRDGYQLQHQTIPAKTTSLSALPYFQFPSIFLPKWNSNRRLYNDQEIPIQRIEMTTRPIENPRELDIVCDLCVKSFFGDEKSLFHRFKLRQISIELKNLLRRRFDNPKNVDCFLVAESIEQNFVHLDSRLQQHNRKESCKFVGCSLVSLLPVDESICPHYNNGKPITSFIKNAQFFPKISNLCVSKIYRGQGIGSKLLERSCEIAKAWGYDQVYLEVEADNVAAIELYKRAGFQMLFRQNINVYDMKSFFLRNLSKQSIVMKKSITIPQREVTSV